MAVTGPGMVMLDTRGNILGRRATYAAATTAPFAAPANTTPFFVIEGSATKTIRVLCITVTAPTLTAVAYNAVNLEKYSTASSGGTPVDLIATPFDSASAATTITVNRVFTAAPTSGSRLGVLCTRRFLGQATTAAAAGQPVDGALEFDFDGNTIEPIVLRGTAEGIGLTFAASPATAVTLGLEVIWTEE